MRTIVVGDVHGCIREMQALVEKVALSPGDRLLFLGDLLDKGPEGPACVRYAQEIGAESLLGNHEETALRWLRHEQQRLETPSYHNPMNTAAKDSKPWQQLSAGDRAWLQRLPIYTEIAPKVIAVHAGMAPGLPLSEQKVARMLRIRWVDAMGGFVALRHGMHPRNPPTGAYWWMDRWDGDYSIVYGHAVHSLAEPRVDALAEGRRCWGIDTGCVYGGHLTALVFDSSSIGTPQVVQVPAFQQYAVLPGDE